MPVGGGAPSSPFFYKNPQYLISLDHSKIFDKQKVMTMTMDAFLTYESAENASVRIFLCKSADSLNNKNHRGRIVNVDEKNIANHKELREAYKKGEAVSTCTMQGSQ